MNTAKSMTNQIYIGILLLLLLFSTYVNKVDTVVAPDEFAHFFEVKLMRNYGTYDKKITGEESLMIQNHLIPAPQWVNFNPTRESLVSGFFPYYSYLQYIISLLGTNAIFYTNLILMMGIFLFLLVIAQKKKSPLVLLLLLFPTLFHQAQFLYQDMFSFYLFIFFFYVAGFSNKYLLEILILGMLVYVRYTNILFVIPLYLFSQYRNYRINSLSYRIVLKWLLLWWIMWALLLIFNKIYYNSYLTIPNTVHTGNDTNYLSAVKENLFTSNIYKFYDLYFSHNINIVLPLVFFFFFLFLRSKFSKIERFIILTSNSLILVFFLTWFKLDYLYKYSLHGSYYRYVLPIFLFLYLYVLLNRKRLFMHRLLMVLGFSTYTIISLYSVFHVVKNWYGTYEQASYKWEKKSTEKIISSYFTGNSIILTNFFSKIFIDNYYFWNGDNKIKIVRIDTLKDVGILNIDFLREYTKTNHLNFFIIPDPNNIWVLTNYIMSRNAILLFSNDKVQFQLYQIN